jgi:NTP pyrophosphatase (non-canonical NTP hydrolase)
MKISEYQAINWERNWTKHWDLPRWGNALAGEVGELCNIIKKIDRDGPSEELFVALGKEMADVLGYLVITAEAAGRNLEQEAITKFNEVSDRIGSLIRIPIDG